jgi:hypothetical protein
MTPIISMESGGAPTALPPLLRESRYNESALAQGDGMGLLGKSAFLYWYNTSYLNPNISIM